MNPDEFDIFRDAPEPEAPEIAKIPSPTSALDDELDPFKQNSGLRSQTLVSIIDDDAMVRQSLSLAFNNKYDVLLCKNGEEGIEMLNERVGAVILDIKMEGKNGFETFVEIKKRYSYMPIIFHSAYQDIKDPYEIMNEYRPFGYVRKGAPIKEMIDTVNSAVTYYQQIRQNEQLVHHLKQLSETYSRFVPHQFLHYLQKDSILDVKLGDQVKRLMTVLFVDIRSFTALSEQMTPEENFRFLNTYLSKMEPVIQAHGGFIDKFIGDAIMALFPEAPDNAVNAAIGMCRMLEEYNAGRKKAGYPPIDIGIGINTGHLMLGIIGGTTRMDGTVISDAVNLASRIEGMTKVYKVPVLMGNATFYNLAHPENFSLRVIDKVTARGKQQPVTIWEVIDGESEEIRNKKRQTMQSFEKGVACIHLNAFSEAIQYFSECLTVYPDDEAAKIYVERCNQPMLF